MSTATYQQPKQTHCRPAHQKTNLAEGYKKSFTPLANIQAKTEGWEILLNLAGYSKEEITISHENSILKVSGSKPESETVFTRKEWTNDVFSRSFTLPKNAEIDHITASMEQGILTIFIPKKEIKVSTISIK
ncbi:MAG: Hsp20/alpha crystallin family protein [Saprospiraceae bacterium]